MSFLHSENIWSGGGHAGDGSAWDLWRGEKLSEFFEFFEFFFNKTYRHSQMGLADVSWLISFLLPLIVTMRQKAAPFGLEVPYNIYADQYWSCSADIGNTQKKSEFFSPPPTTVCDHGKFVMLLIILLLTICPPPPPMLATSQFAQDITDASLWHFSTHCFRIAAVVSQGSHHS